ncbi:MAG: FG-GAP repeat protein [Desulfobulbaceae bacterium]|nr:FG-GAP repeat protein [Desulfobulbaceae bacterium]
MKRIFLFTLFVSFQLFLLLDVCQGQQEVTEQRLSANGGSSLDKLGEAVAISGDFAIVGALGDNSSSESSGAAYILTYNGSSWTQTQKLIASDSSGLSKFGQSVAISGDYAIVGAYGDNGNGASSGAAYIFHYNGTSWVEMQKITANDASSWNKFGQSVAISGDTAIIGAYGDNDRGESAGAAYIFHLDGSNWSQSQKLTAFDTTAWDQFGQSVAISGDYAIIGAYGDSDNGPLSGSAYIFYYNGNNWLQNQKLIANDGAPWDNFGQSVAISANVAIVGAYKDDDKGKSSGSAYVFYNDGSNWLFEQKLTASDGVASDFFGHAVSIYGDYAIAGAYGDDDNGILSGSAYVFYFDGNSWAQIEKLTAADASASDYFGKSVSIYGDHALIGAYGDDINGETSGSTYLFMNFTIPFPKITPSSNTSRVVFFDASRYACDEIVNGVGVGQSCDYQWNFGGAGTVVGGNGDNIIVVQYDSTGIYDIILTMTEKSAGILSRNLYGKATAIDNLYPDKTADFTTVVSGATLTINKTLPTDITSVEIFWGDRVRSVYNDPLKDLMEHTYNRIGSSYNIRIKTIDDKGNELKYTVSDDNDLKVYIP